MHRNSRRLGDKMRTFFFFLQNGEMKSEELRCSVIQQGYSTFSGISQLQHRNSEMGSIRNQIKY